MAGSEGQGRRAGAVALVSNNRDGRRVRGRMLSDERAMAAADDTLSWSWRLASVKDDGQEDRQTMTLKV